MSLRASHDSTASNVGSLRWRSFDQPQLDVTSPADRYSYIAIAEDMMEPVSMPPSDMAEPASIPISEWPPPSSAPPAPPPPPPPTRRSPSEQIDGESKGMRRWQQKFADIYLHQLAKRGKSEEISIFLSTLSPESLATHLTRLIEAEFTPLQYAVKHNRRDATIKLFEANPGAIDDKTKDGDRLLHLALQVPVSKDTKEENEGLIAFLLEKCTSFNEKNKRGQAPLHLAITTDNSIALRHLLNKDDIDVDIKDSHLRTALHLAVLRGKQNFVQLLAETADLSSQQSRKMTPLHLACKSGERKIAHILLEAAERRRGLSGRETLLEAIDIDGNKPLHLAAANGHDELVWDCIMGGTDVDSRGNYNKTALHLAAERGFLSIVYDLTRLQADLDCTDKEKRTPFHRALVRNKIECADFLLEMGARPESTSLFMAVDKNSISTVTLLLQNKVEYGLVEKQQDQTLVFLATKRNYPKVLEVLVTWEDVKKQVKLKNLHGDLPLHLAAKEGYQDCVRVLLDAGADVHTLNGERKTAFHLATENGRTEIVSFILSFDEKVLDDADGEGNTALHLSATEGHENVVKRILDQDVKKNDQIIKVRNGHGYAPLDCAAAKGNANICALLLDKGASFVQHEGILHNPERKFKVSPLLLASRYGHCNVVQLLMERAGNDGKASHLLVEKDIDGWDSLSLAIDYGHRDVAEEILGLHTAIEEDADYFHQDQLRFSKRAGHGQRRVFPTGTGTIQDKKIFRKRISKKYDDTKSEDSMEVDEPRIGTKWYLPKPPLRWEVALGNSRTHPRTGKRDTPLRRAILRMPGLAYDILTMCVKDNKDKIPATTTYNYRFLDDCNEASAVRPHSAKQMDNHPMMIIAKKGGSLAKHMLVKSLLARKLYYTRLVYAFVVLYRLILVVYLTSYLLVTPSPFSLANGTLPIQSISEYMGDCEKMRTILHNPQMNSIAAIMFMRYGKFVLLLAVILRLCFGINWAVRLGRGGYALLYETVLCASMIAFLVDLDQCQLETGIRLDYQWQTGIAAVLLAWLYFVYGLQYVEKIGIYVLMFRDILKTFLLFLPILSIFLTAFSLTFYSLLRNKDEFAHYGMSMMKTLTMMTGEFEYGDVILDDDSVCAQPEEYLLFPITTYTLFTIFLVVMSILVMNLLVGLAVYDVKDIKRQAEIAHQTKQVKFAFELQSVTPIFVKRLIVEEETVPYRDSGAVMAEQEGPETDQMMNDLRDKMINLELKTSTMHHEMKDVVKNSREMATEVQEKVSQLERHLDHALANILEHLKENSDDVTPLEN